MGEYYKELLTSFGYGEECDEIARLYRDKATRKMAADAVTDDMIEALGSLTTNNKQGEYYLTDVIAMAVADGVAVHGVKAPSEVEVMGINDKKQLA